MKSLRNFFVAFLALLSLVGVAGVAQAADPAGDRFCADGPSNTVLAQRIEEALKADPSGLRVRPKNCVAVPYSFLVAAQSVDPDEANLKTVADLPAYFRKLRAVKAETSVYYSTSVIHVRPNGSQDVMLGHETREARPGEVIYENPDTGVQVAMGSCSNIGVERQDDVVVEAECVRIDFPSMSPGKRGNRRMAIRFAHLDTKAVESSGCLKWKYMGDAQTYFETTQECPGVYRRKVIDAGGERMATVVCNWNAVEAAASRDIGHPIKVQNVSGSFYARADGTNSWWLPVSALDGMAVICWEDETGTLRATVGVKREDFVNGVATVTVEHVHDSARKFGRM